MSVHLLATFLLKKNNKSVISKGFFMFRRVITCRSYEPVDFSKFEGKLRGKKINLDSFHDNDQIFLKVSEVKRRSSKVSLHGVLFQHGRSGEYQLKMKFFLHRLLAPVFALMLMYLFAFKLAPMFEGQSPNLLEHLPFKIFAGIALLMTLFNMGQLIYLARRDFKLAHELIGTLLDTRESKITLKKHVRTDKEKFSKVSIEGWHPFENKIDYVSDFNASKMKELLSFSKINALKFHQVQSDIILFKYNLPIDWMGKNMYNPSKPAYSNVAMITNGHILNKKDGSFVVKLKFVSKFYFLFLIPLCLPLIPYLLFQDSAVLFMYVPLTVATFILGLFLFIRTKRYFKLFCQALES
jgi:hypothetical protein